MMLDAAQGVPGGVISGGLVDARATVHVRSGATASDVTLIAHRHYRRLVRFGGTPCDSGERPGRASPASNPTRTAFLPARSTLVCKSCRTRRAPIARRAALASLLGKIAQCTANGFCITGPLEIPLASANTTITPDPSGEVLFGWDDQSTGASLNPDGTWNLPPADFADPVGPNGMKMNASGLAVALRCTMGVDSGGPLGTQPPISDQSSPTPDSALINFAIE